MSKRTRWALPAWLGCAALLVASAGVWLSVPGVALAGLNSWTTSGPYGGDVASLAFSPAYATDHTLFAATDSGVFKSTTGGASWAAANSGLTDCYVLSLAVSPAYATDHTLFVGTLSGGAFKSTTGGASWTVTNSGLTDFDVLSLAFSPAYATDQTLFAGTMNGGVFKSTSGGATWAAVLTEPSGSAEIWCLAVSPAYATDHTIFAGHETPLVLVTQALVTNHALAGSTDDSVVFKSTTGGASWTAVNAGPTDCGVLSLAVSPAYATDQTLFVGTGSGVFESTTGGTSWTAMNAGLPELIVWSLAISPTYATDHTLFAGTRDYGVFKSSSGGASWTSSLPTGDLVTSIALSPAYSGDQTLFAGTTCAGVFASTSGGTNWTAANDGIAASLISSLALSPSYASDQTLFACTGSGSTSNRGIFMSSSGGASWTDLDSGLTDVRAVAVSPTYATDHIVFAAAYAGLFKSTTGGASWTPVGNLVVIDDYLASLAVSPAYDTDQTVFAGTGAGISGTGGIFKSTTGGVSWTAVNDGIDFSGIFDPSVGFIAVSPAYASDQTLFAGVNGIVAGRSSSRIFKSTSGGASWTALNSGATSTIDSLVLSPAYATDHTLFVASGGSLLKSTSGGAGWTKTGLPFGVDGVAISPSYATDQTLFAASVMGEIFKSASGGASWNALSTAGMGANTGPQCVAVSPAYATDKTLFAGTWSGVYSYVDRPAVSAPTLTSFAPVSGAEGTSVTLTGTAFTGATAVAFHGVAATFTVNSATMITTTVPAGATSGTISVTTPAGTGTSATSFTVTAPPKTPGITSFTPAAGPVGTRVTLTGTHFTGATKIAFHGVSAVFSVSSASKITATVPSGATTGTIAVTTPGGTGTSATSFTVVFRPKVTLKLSGLRSGAMRLGRRVTATGRVTPTRFAGSKVKLTVQRKRVRKWVTAKTVTRRSSHRGAYIWKYKPAKRGAYRMRATIAKTAAHTAAKTKWRTFKVK